MFRRTTSLGAGEKENPMKQFARVVLASAMAVALTAPSIALAHPDHSPGRGGDFGDVDPAGGKQHGESSGHLDPVQHNVAVIGKGEVSNPSGASSGGRVADVSAHGNHAYLTSFRADNCLGGGAWIVDIADPTNPTEVGFLPTTDGNYAGEGSQVVTPEFGPYAGRQLFLHQNETCPGNGAELAEATGKPRFLGGINIWDVTDPLAPELLVEHAGDMTPNRSNPNPVHSMYAWSSHVDQRVYAVLVDNVEFTDVDIMDITDPTNPVLVNDTLDLWDLFGVQQSSPASLTQVFNHDMMVYRKGDRYVMNVNYWDGGYVLLDVTDPRPGQVSLIAESDYAELDEEQLKRGREVAPEGNAHQSEFSPDFKYLIGTDEDFAPYGVGKFLITTGDHAGEYASVGVGGAAPVTLLPDLRLNGPTVYVGYACPSSAPVPHRDSVGLPELEEGEEAIAVIQRGPVGDPNAPEDACFPGEKADAAMAAGYDAVVFVNHHAGEIGSPTVPFCGSGAFTQPVVAVCTTHAAYHRLFDSEPNTGSYDPALEPAIGAVGHEVDVSAVFNGWGYVRLFRTQVTGEPGTSGSISQVDTYALPESQEPGYAVGFGDLSVHEVATDPRSGTNLAYLSYYAGGFRVLEYGKKGLKEVGAFIDEGGNNFWGVEVHTHPNGQTYVLASDRDHGLYIFQYTGKIAGGNRGASG
jgi:hypothetical protein